MDKLGKFFILDTILSISTPMEMIEAILAKASDLYDMFANDSKLNIQNCDGGWIRITMNATVWTFWNCGQEGYSVRKFKQTKKKNSHFLLTIL